MLNPSVLAKPVFAGCAGPGLIVQETGNNSDLADASWLNWHSVISLLERSRRSSPSEHSAPQV